MSKNLSEETPGKVVAAQGYGVRQLFRRPAPVATGITYDIFRGRQSFSGTHTTVADGSEAPVVFDSWETSNTDIFLPLVVGGGEATSADEVERIRLLIPGVYTLTFEVAWAGTWGAGFDTSIVMADDYDYPSIVDHASAGKSYEDAGNGLYFSETRTYPPHDSLDSSPIVGGGYAKILWQISQNSGVSKTTAYGTFTEIVYLGTYNPPVFASGGT